MKTSREYAEEAMEQADGDVLEATAALEAMARNDVSVWQVLTEQLLKTACYDACRSICRSERRVIWNTTGSDAGGKGDRVKAHGNMLMDFPLPGGMKLRDATKQDLMDAAGFYERQAAQMTAVASWLSAIASKVKTKTVGDTLTEVQLRAIKDGERASKAAA